MNLQEILNTVRDNQTTEYQARIPEATRNNLDAIRESMLAEENIFCANAFISTILNKLVKTVVHTKLFGNPLKGLKKGKKPLGDTVEEVFVNFLKGEKYDPTGANLLKRTLPDVKTIYHRMNYELQYPVTVSRQQLEKAFTSWDKLESFINNIIEQLYNSAELDEFINMKNLIADALKNKAMKVVDIANPLESEANGREFIKTLKTTSGLMVFPSTQFNSYLDVQEDDAIPVTTFSRKNEQIIIIDTATDTSVSVDVLANTFNMSVADFNDTRKIVIDAFPSVEGVGDVKACIVDEAFFQIYDDFFGITTFENGAGIYTNYYLNVWQTIAYSVLVNAVAFVVPQA